jgi:hypothetical protein
VNRLTIVRLLDAPVDRVREIIGNPGISPGPGVDVEVERPGAPDGAGLARVVKVGPARVHEEIIRVDPGGAVHYRVTKGAPARDYVGSVSVDKTMDGSARVTWDVQFRPLVPGTGWLITRVTRRTLNRVLDAVAASARS